MADDEITAMSIFSQVGSVLSTAKTIEGIFFGDSTPSATEIAQAVAAEVKIIFHDELEGDAVKNATGTLDALRTFLHTDYANAQAEATSHGVTDYKSLYDMLHDATSTPSAASLETAAATLEAWLAPDDNQPVNSNMYKALPICLGLRVHQCLLYREYGTVAAALAAAPPGPNDAMTYKDKTRDQFAEESRTQFDNMRSTAQAAIDTYLQRVTRAVNERVYKVTYHEDTQQLGPYANQPCHLAIMTDEWLSGSQPDTLFSWSAPSYYRSGHFNYQMMICDIWAPYHRVLWNASDEDKSRLDQLVRGYPLNDAGDITDYNDKSGFISQSLDSGYAFGKWAREARGLLMSLDLVATGLPGDTQEDTWFCCQKCGVLYHGARPGVCSDKGPHLSQEDGTNYVIHRWNRPLATGSWSANPTPIPNTQANFVRCTQCQALYLDGSYGGCIASPSEQHQPATGDMLTGADGSQYVDTGNRYVCLGDVPPKHYPASADHPFTPGAQFGLPIHGSAWRMCASCGGLYNSDAPGKQCVAARLGDPLEKNGEHRDSGLPPMWITTLGTSANARLETNHGGDAGDNPTQPPGDPWRS
jgi:hypothetical protein